MKCKYLKILTDLILLVNIGRFVVTTEHTNVVVLGGTGDLARKYLWKSFLQLYSQTADENKTFSFYAGARVPGVDGQNALDKILEVVKCSTDDNICQKKRPSFIQNAKYVQLKSSEHYRELCTNFTNFKSDFVSEMRQLFYLSIPASAYESVAEFIHQNCRGGNVTWTRVVLEKPFGSDKKSATAQVEALRKYFTDEELYRVDHYLEKSVVKEILQFRKSNKKQLEPLLSNQNVDRVEIVVKETIGVKGRIDFYDQYGVVRDILQNHLTELLALVAMQLPQNITDFNEIERHRVNVLKQVKPVRKRSLLLGQYASYLQEAEQEKENVTSSHFTPTFAAAFLEIDNSRWNGVPFVLVSGKHLEERSSYIRVLFREKNFCVSGCYNGNASHNMYPRQLVFQIGHGSVPSPGVLVTKSVISPAWPSSLRELSMTSKDSIIHGQSPGDFHYAIPIVDNQAYDSVVEDVFKGLRERFVAAERVLILWDIWSPVLRESRSLLPRKYQERSNADLNFMVKSGSLHFTVNGNYAHIHQHDGLNSEHHQISSIPSSFRNGSLICKEVETLLQDLASHVQSTAEKAIAERQVFHLALSGGRTPVSLFGILVRDYPDFPWKHTHIWQVDERCVHQNSQESNFLTLQENLLTFIKIPFLNVHQMAVDQAGVVCDPESKGDNQYENLIWYLIPETRFDLILLGLGTDSHTASLFPSSPFLTSNSRLVAFTKTNGAQPVGRMSLLLPVINLAREITVVVTGKEKHEILHRIAHVEAKNKDFPITFVQPSEGKITWFIDYDAWFGKSQI